MELQINNINIDLSINNDKVFTSSKQIAEVFGKRHADVIKGINN